MFGAIYYRFGGKQRGMYAKCMHVKCMHVQGSTIDVYGPCIVVYPAWYLWFVLSALR